MKTINYFKFGRRIVLLLLGAAAVLPLAAQQRTGGGGGGGGGTGGGGGGSSAYRSSGSSSSGSGSSGSRDYPNSTLPGDYTVSIDPETHSLVILSDDVTFSNLSQVVKRLDRPKPQVLIKVVFVEVQHDDDLDFGIEGTYTHYNPLSFITNTTAGQTYGLANQGIAGQTIGQSTMPPGQGIYTVMGNDFTATVRAIASASKVEVLSRPSIMVRNNQPATITVGQSVPLVTGVTYPSLTGGPVSTVTYQSVGIILQVTPFISSDGLVEMIVAPQISDLSSQTVAIASNINVPVLDLRSASTVVVAPDGQTVIIGGLMENDKTYIDSKIPLLGDIPYLGVLFTHKQQAITKKELLIFLTPHIVNMPSQMAAVAGSEGERADLSRKDFKEKEMYKFFDTLPVRPNTIWSSPNKITNGPPGVYPPSPDDVNK